MASSQRRPQACDAAFFVNGLGRPSDQQEELAPGRLVAARTHGELTDQMGVQQLREFADGGVWPGHGGSAEEQGVGGHADVKGGREQRRGGQLRQPLEGDGNGGVRLGVEDDGARGRFECTRECGESRRVQGGGNIGHCPGL